MNDLVNIDISTLVHRDGFNPVGISRVEAELAKTYWRMTETPVIYWRYDQDMRCFIPLSLTYAAHLLKSEPRASRAASDIVPVDVSTEEPIEAVAPTGKLVPIDANSIFEDSWVSRESGFVYSGSRHLSIGFVLPVTEQSGPKNLIVQVGTEIHATYKIHRDQPYVINLELPEDHVETLIMLSFEKCDESSADARELGALILKELTSAQFLSEPAAPEPQGRLLVVGLPWGNQCMEVCYDLKTRGVTDTELIIYDVIPLLMPEFCVPNMTELFGKFIADAAWTASTIYCISDHTEKDLLAELERLELPVPTTKRIHLGDSLSVPTDDDSYRPFNLERGKYVMFVSTLEPRKNHALLFEIWRSLIEELEGTHDIPKLVLVGGKGWNVDDLVRTLSQDLRLSPHYVTVLSDVSDKDLGYLYKNALFTAYPSRYEGWGLPIAESLSYGKVCVSASTSSLPEVGQGLTLTLDHRDFFGWKAAIKKLILEPDYLHETEQKIIANYKPSAWSDAFHEVVGDAK